MADLSTTLPLPVVQAFDPDTGSFTHPWWYYFQRIYQRTGAASGGSFGPPETVTLGASPFVYTATQNGSVLICGPGMIRVEIQPADGIWYPTGGWYGSCAINAGDSMRFTFIGSPSVTFLPGS